MKLRSLLICAALTVPAISAHAEKKKSLHDRVTGQGYGTAGCGLGSIIFGDKPGTVQVFAATTNAWGGQTFAISSGTSNCEDSGTKVSMATFIQNNKIQLQTDAAKGSGETLSGLNKIMGCKDQNTFNKNLQSNFVTVFNKDLSAEQITDNIINSVQNDLALNNSCENLI